MGTIVRSAPLIVSLLDSSIGRPCRSAVHPDHSLADHVDVVQVTHSESGAVGGHAADPDDGRRAFHRDLHVVDQLSGAVLEHHHTLHALGGRSHRFVRERPQRDRPDVTDAHTIRAAARPRRCARTSPPIRMPRRRAPRRRGTRRRAVARPRRSPRFAARRPGSALRSRAPCRAACRYRSTRSSWPDRCRWWCRRDPNPSARAARTPTAATSTAA